MAAAGLAGCDGQQQRAGDELRQAAEAPGLGPAEGAAFIGTWRVRLADTKDRADAQVYTFTADGRVTVAPGRVCRYRLEAEALAVDCDGQAGDSARGQVERRDANTFLWRVDDKVVHLERQAGVKEQQ